jgi:carbon storage regulator
LPETHREEREDSTRSETKRILAMLVLTRKLMEKLVIGDNICITVVRIEGGQVRLGIEAPPDVRIVRSELVPDLLDARGKFREPVLAAIPSVGEVTAPRASAHGIDTPRRERSR